MAGQWIKWQNILHYTNGVILRGHINFLKGSVHIPA